MTTMRPREATNPKERRSSAPSSPQRSVSSNGRRSPRPNTPVNKQCVAADKPTTPNYLKPKSTTPVNPPKPTKTIQPAPTPTSKRISVPKPSEKPALVAPERRRSLASLPSPPRKTGPIRLPTAAPKQFNTLKPSMDKIPKVNFEKIPKVTNGAKTAQVARRNGPMQVKKEVPSVMPQNQEPQKQENEFLVDDEVAPKLEDKHVTDHDSVPPPIETRHTESPELKKNNEAQEVTYDHVQLKEEQLAEVICIKIVVNEGEAKEVVKKVDDVKTLKVIKPPQRGPVVAKKEAVRNNDVIEEAKSKFLEKRKNNKVLALVGAFETVMALQEPEGQQGQQP